jgi:RimJ/RimL family protein N-acetyltransferase
MDQDTVILEVRHSECGDVDLRSGEVERRRPLVLDSEEFVNDLIAMWDELDVFKLNADWFKAQLFAWNAYFEEVEDVGLIFLTDIIPGFTASFHCVFWDKQLGELRRQVMTEFLRECFDSFKLTRIQATVPELNPPYIKQLRKVGFVEEGVIRQAWREPDMDYNVHVLGLLKGEVNG